MKARTAGREATFVDAVDAVRDKALIDRIRDGVVGRADYPLKDAEVACFLSHLKALRTFVDSCDDEQALILEDDVMFHKNFDQIFSSLEIPYMNVVMLSHYVSSYKGVEAFNEQYNTIGPEVYGCYAYIILRDYALELLHRYEGKKFSELHEADGRYTSEHITRFSGGVYLKQPLFIEESLDTHIQHAQSIQWHRNYFSQFGFENYV